MVLKKITYFENNIKKNILVKKVSNFSTGLMLKKSSLPLFFDLGKEKSFSITALLCGNFTAITLDKYYNLLSKTPIKKGRIKKKLYGHYLIEILEK